MDELQFGDAEIQAIMDIRPSSVVAAPVGGSDGPHVGTASGKEAQSLCPNLFEYFGFKETRALDPNTFYEVREVKRCLEQEIGNVDDWFKLLRIIERQFDESDPYSRLRNVLSWIVLKKGYLTKSILDQQLIDPMDIYVEHAKSTGNWSDAIRLARKRETESKAPASLDS